MKGLLVRIGIDQAFGGWNCPLDPTTGDFVYVPIPERRPPRSGLARRYGEVLGPLDAFCARCGLDQARDLRLPMRLIDQPMHLDPDFSFLTYGDTGTRAIQFRRLERDDVLAFYAGLRSYDPLDRRLLYGLVGLFVVDEVVDALDVPEERWHENAHTRRLPVDGSDVIIRARPGVSGRLERAIPIGEWRNRAYRVTDALLQEWGGLSVADGFIQRSGWPPSFLDAMRFCAWFRDQAGEIVARNN